MSKIKTCLTAIICFLYINMKVSISFCLLLIFLFYLCFNLKIQDFVSRRYENKEEDEDDKEIVTKKKNAQEKLPF